MNPSPTPTRGRQHLRIQPISFREAAAFIADYHRHMPPPVGWKFGIAVTSTDDHAIHGVVMVGRPVSRRLDDGWTLEVNRCCTDGTPHVASKLYGAAWRVAQNLGFRRMVTYTLANTTEHGASLRGAGWVEAGELKGASWTCASRPRDTKNVHDRIRWFVGTIEDAPKLLAYGDRVTNDPQQLLLTWED